MENKIILITLLLAFTSFNLAKEADDLSTKTESYELYAQNTSELKIAQEQLDYSVEKFKKYFGEAPPKIAVVIVYSPEDTFKIDRQPFTKRGLQVLSFYSDEYIKKLKLNDVKVLSHEAGHLFFQSYIEKIQKTEKPVSTEASKYGHPLIPDWFDEATATLCEFPVLQTRRLEFLKKNLDKTIPFEEFLKMDHPLPAKLDKGNTPDGKTVTGGASLSDEQKKKLLEKLKSGGNVTINSKSPTEEEKKLLENILGGKSDNETTSQAGNGGGVIHLSDSSAVTDRERMFYAQALFLTKFIAEKNGDLSIAQIAKNLIERKDSKSLFSSLKFSNLEEMEMEWKKWIKGQ